MFNPCAYYDKHMDCIRIELRDCSVKEVRMNEILTIHLDNAPDVTQPPLVGLTIKGVKHLFTEHNLPLAGIVEITEILNKIASAIEAAIQSEHEKRMASQAIDGIRLFARTTELKVDLSKLALAA